MPSAVAEGVRIAIDRGGTFYDFWARVPGHEKDVVFKLLTVCPDEYDDAPTEGIRRILEAATGSTIARGTPLDLSPVESIRMGTTVATNALLERKDERVALLITKGFGDLLVIGNQARPRLFDLSIRKLDRLYERVVEGRRRIPTRLGWKPPSDPDLFHGVNGEVLRRVRKLDAEAVRRDLDMLWTEGYRSLAIALVHSYDFPDHELEIGKMAKEMGFKVSLSSQLQAMINLVPRAHFRKGFKGELEDEHGSKLLLSQSHGGLVKFSAVTGLRAILSGPAGGVIGYAKTCYDTSDKTPVLDFDMGGTLEHVFESTIAEVPIQCPQLDVNTVAAGGGSVLAWTGGLFKVRPESAGAYPGPACYGNGGPLTIPDANCFLGRSLCKAVELPVSSPFEKFKGTTDFPLADTADAKTQRIYFEKGGWTSALVFHIQNRSECTKVQGPAVIFDETQTVILDHDSHAVVLEEHLVIDIAGKALSTQEVDPIKLSVFGHRLMSIAEQMGRTLQKTSISTNIKERLDYSCAIFSASGSLVANAPHIPGHLWSMSTAIRYRAEKYGRDGLEPGDVILSNHPCAGGTHLPDLTVITPVFDDDDDPKRIFFFVANRGHHADIGGILAGSMPPNLTELWQEGAAIESFKLVSRGVFDEAGLVHELSVKPARYPGCSGTRTLRDNIADLKASVAANNRGIRLIQDLVRQYSWPVVEFYMEAIQQNAQDGVRVLLKGFGERVGGRPLKAVDWLDDGTALALCVTIDERDGSALFDFTGTGPEAFNNLDKSAAEKSD
ncbi:Uncharacterized protein C8035_v000882 [Colletotrichum spinosum]|uniref:5-oxoprolinase n=1 Tax=Colletotrichum spinosum TaxID=1347390 RepID=A0A4V3HRI1_9PEZI|nr:Uncharacterized protein C8035_v000882 [Colletotrichum spinosum]